MMTNKELLEYVRKEQERGTPEKTIRASLSAKKWPKKEIDDVFQKLSPHVSFPVAKGLGIIWIVSAALFFSQIYFLLQFSTIEMISYRFGSFDSFLIRLVVLVLGAGTLVWLIRGGVSYLIATKGWKAEGRVRGLLFGYARATLPNLFIIGGLVGMVLGDVGIFLSFFFSSFSLLLVFFMMVRAIMMHLSLDWKRGIVTVFLSEVLIFILSFGFSAVAFSPPSGLNLPSPFFPPTDLLFQDIMGGSR